MKKRYITLCNSEKYIKGTLAMYESLNATGTEIPLVIFCSSKTPAKVKDVLYGYAQLCDNNPCKLEILEADESIILPEEVERGNKWLRWNGTFDKLLVFGLTQYDKLVFIDSDMLVLKRLDHLFDCPHLSACCDGQYDKHNINSGLMVIEPTSDKAEMARITGFLSEVVHNTQFGDQDIIRLAFPDWKTREELHLSEQYNLFFENVAQKKYEMDYDITESAKNPIYIVHFIGYDKPWYEGKQLKWKVYIAVWKARMCRQGRKRYKNCAVERVWKKYQYFLRSTKRKLKEINVKIYEMG